MSSPRYDVLSAEPAPSTKKLGERGLCVQGSFCSLTPLTIRSIAGFGGYCLGATWSIADGVCLAKGESLRATWQEIRAAWGFPKLLWPKLTSRKKPATVYINRENIGFGYSPYLKFHLSNRITNGLCVTICYPSVLSSRTDSIPDFPSIYPSLLHIYLHLLGFRDDCVHDELFSFLLTGECTPSPSRRKWLESNILIPNVLI